MRRWLVIAAALAALWALPAPAPAATPCLGAAARDPDQPCFNPGLRLSVRPTLTRSLLVPSYPCEGHGVIGDPEDRADGPLFICTFGAPVTRADRTVALIGDSHAMAWRAAVAGALKRLNWRGIDMTRSHCAFSTTVRRLDEEDEVSGCVAFNQRVITWLTEHPEVTGAFVAHQTGGTPYFPIGAASPFASETFGFALAWSLLPDTVTQIFAIRDNPNYVGALAVQRCVARARAALAAPGTYCARPRRSAVRRDAFAGAVALLDSPRYSLLDLNDLMCDRRRCFPVVGGVRVTKDGAHLTRLFASTLGPFLARAVSGRLLPGYGDDGV